MTTYWVEPGTNTRGHALFKFKSGDWEGDLGFLSRDIASWNDLRPLVRIADEKDAVYPGKHRGR